MTSPIVAQCSLYSDHNGSDKVYQIQLLAVEGGFEVHYQNGARGGTLASGKKTPKPVDQSAAEKIFARLKKEKMNGSSHYREIDAAPGAYVAPVDGRVLSGVFPMLLTPIFDEGSLDKYLTDDNFCLQEKHDGERLETIHRGALIGSNKLGFVRGIPQVILGSLESAMGVELDSELVGEVLQVFDALALDGRDLRKVAYRKRLSALAVFMEDAGSVNVRPVITYYTTQEKRAALVAIKARGGEGVVFKDLRAEHAEGTVEFAFKYKFTATATIKVHSVTPGKRSVRMCGFDADGREVPMGKVTIPANHNIPAVGQYCEVSYLYAYPGTHSLAQPVYLGVRTDQDDSGCLLSKLKYKVKPSGDDDEPVEIDQDAANGDTVRLAA